MIALIFSLFTISIGLHHVIWAEIFVLLIVISTAIMLLVERRYIGDPQDKLRFDSNTRSRNALPKRPKLKALNAVSTLIKCGPTICADPPTSYKLIDDMDNN